MIDARITREEAPLKLIRSGLTAAANTPRRRLLNSPEVEPCGNPGIIARQPTADIYTITHPCETVKRP